MSGKFETKPLYAQVHEEIARRILSGHYKPGQMLPNEWEFARELGVSIGTLRRAVQALVDAQLLIRSSGKGTVVADRRTDEYQKKFDSFRDRDGNRVNWEYRVISATRRRADDVEAERLRLEAGDEVVVVERTRSYLGAPVIYELARLPAAIFNSVDGVAPDQTTIESLSEAHSLQIGLIEKRLWVEEPDFNALKHLSAKRNDERFMNYERLVFGADGTPLEWCRATANCRDLCFVAEIRQTRIPHLDRRRA